MGKLYYVQICYLYAVTYTMITYMHKLLKTYEYRQHSAYYCRIYDSSNEFTFDLVLP